MDELSLFLDGVGTTLTADVGSFLFAFAEVALAGVGALVLEGFSTGVATASTYSFTGVFFSTTSFTASV